MGKPTSFTPVDAPQTIYLKKKVTGRVYKRQLIGQTSRSWVTGVPWNPDNFTNRDYERVEEKDYLDQQWADSNRLNISKIVGQGYDPLPYAILKQIADLIGYEEGK